jgi:DNA mismatch repair protein MutL
MGKVRRLPSDLANQIAAGEVVERPASVVKELVENALDAAATRITVEVEQGGMTSIRVTDDGEGMEEEDARLSLERHATSKITSVEDLHRIATFGFRGEALPTIGSVARLTMVTRMRAHDEAVELVVEGGGEPKVRPAGAAPGTAIEVRDLFFNVPARRKFLKSTGTESAHVGETVLLAALSRPDVTFILARDRRVVREFLRVETRGERARQAIVDDVLEPCFAQRGPLRIEAHLAAPERARAGAVGLHLFVNGRPVRDRQLGRAVAQAYGSVLEPGRYPLGVVYLDVPYEQVDVNVHPQKAEIRFADARGVFDAVTRELHGALSKAFAVPPLGPTPYARAFNAWRSGGASNGFPPWTASSGSGGGLPSADGAPVTASTPMFAGSAPPSGAEAAPLAGGTGAEADPWQLLPASSPSSEGTSPTPEPSLFAGQGFYSRLRFVGQVRGTFLVCEGDDGMYVLDQHAAAERVTFERLRRAYATRGVVSQRLLTGEVVELLPAEVAALEENADAVAALGLELRAVGVSAVAVHSVPALVARASPARLVRDVVAEVSRATGGRPFGGAVDLVLATMACHGSTRAGDTVSREEATALLAALDGVDFSGHCPHGRPVITRIPYDELERRVGR